MSPTNRNLHAECLMHAAHSRMMWLQMKRTGYGWTWDYYRGWLLDARSVRLNAEFKALGSKGAKRALPARPVFSA